MKFWIKAWVDILDDRKMGHLSDTHWRRAVELFLLAGRVDQDGLLPPLPQIAWELRITEAQLQQELDCLASLNIITTNNNSYIVTNFAKRQAKMGDTERKRQQRIREMSHTSHNNVTKRDTDMQNMHDDDDKLIENATILGCDVPGFKDCNPQLIQLWADNVQNIPEHWGAGIIINRIKAGKSPPKPEPALDFPLLPEQLNGVHPAVDPVDPLADIWKQVQDKLKLELTQATFEQWIKNTQLQALEPEIIIQAPSTYAVDWLENRLKNKIGTTLATVGYTAPVVFISNKNGPAIPVSEANAVERTN